MEYIDYYDEDGTIIKTAEPRDNQAPEGCWIMAVGIWVQNDQGQLLLTKRSPQKSYAPNLWENTGGHLMTGEDPVSAVIRELWEETGVTVEREDVVFLGDAKNNPYLGKNYGVRKNFRLSEVKLQEGETCEAKAVSLLEFERMAAAGELAPSVTSHLECYKEKFDLFVRGMLI